MERTFAVTCITCIYNQIIASKIKLLQPLQGEGDESWKYIGCCYSPTVTSILQSIPILLKDSARCGGYICHPPSQVRYLSWPMSVPDFYVANRIININSSSSGCCNSPESISELHPTRFSIQFSVRISMSRKTFSFSNSCWKLFYSFFKICQTLSGNTDLAKTYSLFQIKKLD